MSEHAGGNRDALLRLYDVLATGRVEELDEIMAPGVITDYPQSGERLEGRENIKAMISHYPGGSLRTSPRPQVIGGEERYMMTPTFNLVKVQGGGDTLVGTVLSRYPDGTDWYIISVVHFHDGVIVRAQQYFAPKFDPPAWRAQWVRPIPESERLG